MAEIFGNSAKRADWDMTSDHNEDHAASLNYH